MLSIKQPVSFNQSPFYFRYTIFRQLFYQSSSRFHSNLIGIINDQRVNSSSLSIRIEVNPTFLLQLFINTIIEHAVFRYPPTINFLRNSTILGFGAARDNTREKFGKRGHDKLKGRIAAPADALEKH